MSELEERLTRPLAERYVIERKIGAGGMATVFLARDLKHDRQVALKILEAELAAVMGVERFLAEISVTAHLQHPNILPLFDSGETPSGAPFYVMPFVEGESLRQRLDREKQLPVHDAVRIATSIAAAVDYAHRHHVVHRDLKPENVLFQEGQPLVSDFGIALAVSHAGGHRITQTGLSLGTPAYMSPEQATGDRAIDGRTDVYSLGAMLYEMLTGEPPHTGTTAQAIIARVLTETPRAVRSVRPAVPAHVAAAVERALEKLPADRWETAAALCDALTETAASGAAFPPRREKARWFGLVAPMPLALVVIALAAAIFGLVEWRAANHGEGPTIRFEVPLSAGSLEALSIAPAISPDGNRIAYAQIGGAGQSIIATRTLSDLTARELPGSEAGIQPTFSPDGEWVAFFAVGKLKKIHLATGSIRTLASMNLPEGIDWAGSDEIVVSVDNRLATVAVAGGAPRWFTKLDTAAGEQAQRGPHVMSGTESVLFYSWRGSIESSKIGVASLATGETRYLDIAGAAVGVLDGWLIYATQGDAFFAVPFDVRQARVTGTPVRLADHVPVIGNGLARASLSPSGSLVYARGTSMSELVIADLQGMPQTVLGTPKGYSFPRFSPDGKRIALTIAERGSADVWIYDIASNTLSRVTHEGSRNDRAEWTPDGKRLIYSSVGKKELTALWIQNADLSGEAQLLEGRKGDQILEGIISPDNQSLVFRSTAPEHPHDIWYRRLSGDTTRRAYVTAPSSEYAPRLSPSGKWLAYGSNRDGSSQVYVEPFPPTGAHYQVSDQGGVAPIWAPDGSRIYYANAGRLFAATVQLTPTFAVLSRQLLMTAPGYNLASPVHPPWDIAPDGKHLLLLRPTQADNGLVVVHDWRSELRTLSRK
ncbi:MAG: protein kinase domain-containing protein [Gemmatimonadaceae bacterium]